jgi:hypothetical protein
MVTVHRDLIAYDSASVLDALSFEHLMGWLNQLNKVFSEKS